MAVPRRRHSKARVARARTHKKLTATSTVKCDNCGAPKAGHRICQACGTYKGRTYHVVVKS